MTLRPSLLFIILTFLSIAAQAQSPIEDQIYIWPGTAPGTDTVTVVETIEDRDPNGGDCHLNRSVRKVTQPSIKHFAPANPNGSAVLICPGGGYALLAYDKEGYAIAQWYNERDITAFVLKYRLPIDGHENRANVPLQDAQRAMRFIRANALDYNIDPDRIGVMGGSAGGHLAACLSNFYDRETYSLIDDIDTFSARPDFTVLMYPVVSFQDSLTHGGSRSNLLGDPITEQMKNDWSPELHVNTNTPPAFIFHSMTDGSVKYQNSRAYAHALENIGVSNSLNIYRNGGHGVGFCEAGSTEFARWPIDLDDWLEKEEWTTACLGDIPTIRVLDQDTIHLIASPADSYQWYRNGILFNNYTDSILTPPIIGNYMVAVPGTRENSGTPCMLFSEEVEVDVLIGLNDILEQDVSIYPNPAWSSIGIEKLPNTISDTDYLIYDQNGSILLSGKKEIVASSFQLKVSHLSNGLYYLLLQTDMGIIRKRFVIAR